MIYNIKTKKINPSLADCENCDFFNKETFACEGTNKVCFEYDEKTKTIIDGITHLPLKLDEINK